MMQDYDKTTFVGRSQIAEPVSADLCVTIFDGAQKPRMIRLGELGRNVITFGRARDNDIVLSSPLVSSLHGRFVLKNRQWCIEDRALFGDRPSTNGLIYNNRNIVSRFLHEGDFIRIDDGVETIPQGVLLVFSSRKSANRWDTFQITGQRQIRIGRGTDCDILLPHISISSHHARIVREGERWYFIDNNSTNGSVVNNVRVRGKWLLHEKDVITISNSKLIFTSSRIDYCCYKTGISIDASQVVVTRGKGKKKTVTTNNVSMSINPGELVAIIGGSGAGKSTILNCLCGYLPPAKGEVYINGINLYRNFDALKKLIGYVPQSDIVYDNLTLQDMLRYTAKLRLPGDTSAKEREAAVDRAISLVELDDKKTSYIKRLSGGQKKRASIAVELLSDPNLIFLDEPASGLDPGTERNLMESLRKMADSGKTVVLVTHSTLQLKICDKIAFMGRGGNLCFLGSYEEALAFFGVSDVIDIYALINDHSLEWRKRYDRIAERPGNLRGQKEKVTKEKQKHKSQLLVLCSRYMKLLLNDRTRLLLLMIQAAGLPLLIALVADGQQFEQYEMTKSLLFALSCCAFWVGMLNAIQEICKERNILKREYMTGVSLGSYLMSKVLVLGLLCLIQSFLILLVFRLTVGIPDTGLFTSPFLELLITTFLTALASTAMGLLVSSLVANADRAMTLAPILLMPQILFSGLIFKLSGATEIISWFAVCRWSMEGYGTTAHLNTLELRLQQQGLMVEHEAESFFEFTTEHMLFAWGILLAFVVGCMILARIFLSRTDKS